MDNTRFKLQEGEVSVASPVYQTRIYREGAHERYEYVVGKDAKMLSGRGKYEILNYKGLKESYETAKEQCPIAADAILILLWDDVINSNRLEFLAKDWEERVRQYHEDEAQKDSEA